MKHFRFASLALFLLATSVSAQIKPVILPEEEEDQTPETYQILWPAEPGARYEVQRSTNLVNWAIVPGFPAAATGLVQRMPFAPEIHAQFFRIRQIDEQAPAIAARFPDAGAFAVRRSAGITIGVTDATGVDPASIRLQVGSLGGFTTASKEFAYTNGVITLTNSGTVLGAYGETVPISLAVADTLGNRATNAWSFKLEVEPQVVTNLFVFGSPQAQLMGQRIGGGRLQPRTAAANRWTLESIQPDRLVIAYTGGTPPAIVSGAYLCNLSPTKADEIFYRKVTGLINDAARQRLTLVTVDVSLEEMVKQGSVSLSGESAVLMVGTDGAIRRAASFDGQVRLDPIGFSLDGASIKLRADGFETTIGDLTLSAGNALPWLDLEAEALHWWLTPSIRASLEFEQDGLRRFEGIVRGDLDAAMILDVDVLLLGKNVEREVFNLPELLEPSVWIYLGNIGPVPVFAQIKFDLKLAAEAEARADLKFRFGFRQQASAEFGIRYEFGLWYERPDVTWVRDIRFAPTEVEPFTADINSELSLKLKLEPSLSFLVYGLAGAEASLAPRGGVVFETGMNKPLTGRLEADVSLNLAPSGLALAWLNPKPTLSLNLWEEQWHLFPNEPALAFVTQPSDVSAPVGDSIRLTASVNRTQDVSYQWYRDGVPLPFETRSSLILLNVNRYHEGAYFVRVRSGREILDSTVATVATLTVRSTALGPAPAGFVRIPAGTFTMGSPTTERERDSSETRRIVTLTRDFYMSKYEVTQREYLAVMGNNPSYFTTKDISGNPISPDLNRPVETVSWNGAMDYCAKLTASEQAAGRLPAGWEYRLPTEAEWEYACRAGTSTPFHYGPDLRSGMANFNGRSEYVGGTGTVNNPDGAYLGRTTTVGSYQRNAFGLYDMHGNVLEWCLDLYFWSPSGSVTYPRRPNPGSNRVLFRGGSWGSLGRYCRSASRDYGTPDSRKKRHIGFRVVLAPGSVSYRTESGAARSRRGEARDE